MVPSRLFFLTGLLLALGCGGGKDSGESGYGEPVAGLSLVTPRGSHTATLLKDGRVLVAGGIVRDTGSATAQAEVIDPMRNEIVPASPMGEPRRWHTATHLPDGRVLIAGGTPWGAGGDTRIALESAEIFDPATGRFSPTGPMAFARFHHTATLLRSGKVLIAGGDGPNPDRVWAAGELYDPISGRFQLLQHPMAHSRTLHSATLLDSGKVLIAGGVDWSSCVHDSAEIFEPESQDFRLLDSTLPRPFTAPRAGIISSGRVLFHLWDLAVIFEPSSEKFFHTNPPINGMRFEETLVSLPNAVVIIGGKGSQSPPPVFGSIEKYTEAQGGFLEIASLSKPRAWHTATRLTDGRVLVVGGTGPNDTYITECEILTLD